MQDGLELEFWCYSSLWLDEIFDKFRSAFPVVDEAFTHDAENVWEWFEGVTADGRINFNISRPHEDLDEFGVETQPIASEPIRFSLLLHDSQTQPKEIGSSLAAALGVEVHTGDVTYLRGDEFEYRVHESFLPP